MQSAYLLHARDYRDTSLLVELLTPECGRISAIARGARSSRRGYSQRAILQPFQPLWLEVAGNAELKTLRQVEARAVAVPLRRQGLLSGLYVNELLCRLLHRDDPHPALFDDYEQVLRALLQIDQLDIALRHFELRLLEELGYGINLTVDAISGADIEADTNYHFDANSGLSRADSQPLSANCFSGGDILDFAAENYTVNARRTLKWLCRAALQPHLGSKPLRSRSLFSGER
ncbi:MAG TPA: DNA repair protein RecO [Spongiibacteraceae bacterium]